MEQGRLVVRSHWAAIAVFSSVDTDDDGVADYLYEGNRAQRRCTACRSSPCVISGRLLRDGALARRGTS